MTAPLKSIEGTGDIAAAMADIGHSARAAARLLALAPTAQKDKALKAMAAALRAQNAAILAANAEDLAEARSAGLSGAILDRLGARCRAGRGHGARHRDGGRAQGPGRPSDRSPGRGRTA